MRVMAVLLHARVLWMELDGGLGAVAYTCSMALNQTLVLLARVQN